MTSYIATTDAEETANKVQAAGGNVMVRPFQVVDQGSIGVFSDPTGATFCVWQAGNFRGAELVNEPGGFCWNELVTRDLDGAKAFYSNVFGWVAKSNPMPDGNEYVEWQLGGRSIGGAFSMGSMYPPTAAPHWLVYFAVGNVDDAVKRAVEAGGSVLAPAVDIPQGRLAVLSDLEGAEFAIIQMAR